MNVTAVCIVAIIAWAFVSLFSNHKDGKYSKGKWQSAESKMSDLESEIAQMNERIQVLEKIVVDEKYELNRKFDELNK
ncbi:MAG: hypothetical protein AAGJ37_04650 [Pseudomonadota bacterium]